MAVAVGGSGTVYDHLLPLHLPCKGRTRADPIQRRGLVTKGPSGTPDDPDQTTVAGGLAVLLQSSE